MKYKQLIINPGSTSTKLAVYQDQEKLCQETIDHPSEELSIYETIPEQIPFRTEIVKDFLKKNNIELSELAAIVGRGGMVYGIKNGGYLVNDQLFTALGDEKYSSPHSSNLGGMIAKELADPLGIPAFIYDAVTGSELSDVAKVTGFPEIVRQSCCHVLNSRSMAMKYANENNLDYNKLKLVVAHLGGGISVSAHANGQIIDSVGDDDGPFSPERGGSVQMFEFLKLCYSGKYTEKEIKKKLRGQGGMIAYLGTSDAREIEKMIDDGNKLAELIYEAEAYQVAKAIGLLAVTLKGKIDAIIITGGMANSTKMTGMINDYVKFLGPVVVKPGENEMEALAFGGLRLLKGEEKPSIFALPKND